jgi:hypothetical protein
MSRRPETGDDGWQPHLAQFDPADWPDAPDEGAARWQWLFARAHIAPRGHKLAAVTALIPSLQQQQPARRSFLRGRR